MVDKNLFLYDLAVVAIFKDEARYLKEWLDYHLLAGVEHFYLYNNESSDNFTEVLASYIEKNLITLINLPGRLMQYPAYEDAIGNFRFESRYMAFIDIDEFILPKSNRSIVEVVDEILSADPNAAGLGINWQHFGSNGQTAADYSRGVLERFTRRAPSEWDDNSLNGNAFKKVVANPRAIRYAVNPHFFYYFNGKFDVNSNGGHIKPWHGNVPILADKIVVNHYYVKSHEEYRATKMKRGHACSSINPYSDKKFNSYDRNEVFDDDVLKYRAARAENFSFESDEQRVSRVINSIFKTLTQKFSPESLQGNIETFFTCRAAAEKFQIKIGNHFAEELALNLIHQTFAQKHSMSFANLQQFLKALPEILPRPFPICKEINELAQQTVIPTFCETLKSIATPKDGNFYKSVDCWKEHSDMIHLKKFLRLIN